jgi:hypothetical protein
MLQIHQYSQSEGVHSVSTAVKAAGQGCVNCPQLTWVQRPQASGLLETLLRRPPSGVYEDRQDAATFGHMAYVCLRCHTWICLGNRHRKWHCAVYQYVPEEGWVPCVVYRPWPRDTCVYSRVPMHFWSFNSAQETATTKKRWTFLSFRRTGSLCSSRLGCFDIYHIAAQSSHPMSCPS